MGIISWVVFGLIAGILAKWIMPGKDGGGFFMTIILGVVGAVVGGWISTFFGFGKVDGFNFGSFVVAAADEALHGRNGVLRVGDSLVLSGLADNALAVFAEALDRRSGAVAFGVHQNGGLIAFHNRHRGVRGAQVDTQNLAHIYSALSR